MTDADVTLAAAPDSAVELAIAFRIGDEEDWQALATADAGSVSLQRGVADE